MTPLTLDMPPLTRDFKGNTEAGFPPSISSRLGNRESISVWDRLARAIQIIGPLMIGFASSTRFAYEQNPDLAQTVLISRLGPIRRRKGRRISIEEARQIAIRTMQMTDRLLAEERRREAEYLFDLSEREEGERP